ncbi:MAG: helix-turn-helix transcriptional regulator [Candidatus Gracilibacteria bacterium]|jgi:transcriptional regulator with XRE-family HTH domain
MEYNIKIIIILNMRKTIFTEDHKYLVEKLKKARLENGFDQKQVADLLKKTQSFISKIESGQRRVDIIQLREFSEIYKKPLSYFIKQ